MHCEYFLLKKFYFLKLIIVYFKFDILNYGKSIENKVFIKNNSSSGKTFILINLIFYFTK